MTFRDNKNVASDAYSSSPFPLLPSLTQTGPVLVLCSALHNVITDLAIFVSCTSKYFSPHHLVSVTYHHFIFIHFACLLEAECSFIFNCRLLEPVNIYVYVFYHIFWTIRHTSLLECTVQEEELKKSEKNKHPFW